MKSMRIAMVQMNSTVGDLDGNLKKITDFIRIAKDKDADIIIFPELAIPGYLPEDLLLKPQFVKDNMEIIEDLRKHVEDIIAIVGFVHKEDGVYNAAAVIHKGHLLGVYQKICLTNDEFRYFKRGSRLPVYMLEDVRFTITISQDIQEKDNPFLERVLSVSDILINIAACPYHMAKIYERQEILSKRAKTHGVIICHVNAVGGQDEVVFDGAAMLIDKEGKVISRGKQFKEELIICDIPIEEISKLRSNRKAEDLGLEGIETIQLEKSSKERSIAVPIVRPLLDPLEEVYCALELGTRDYVTKNHFDGVILGISGGIDSALVATIAADALGPQRVIGVFMPSPYTSKESREDAFELAKNLKIGIIELGITEIFNTYIRELDFVFKGLKRDTTEENIQARIRGNILMALSNKFGYLVLATGNKSEMSVGYATLYGDMAGGFAVIKDVPKTLVYELAKWRNQESKVIPERMFTKAPSAELRENQRDTDMLPPYEILDPILKAYIEEDRTFEEILKLGGRRDYVEKTIRMVDRSEYKRRQAPPGIKITAKALGKDRRFPITNAYKSF